MKKIFKKLILLTSEFPYGKVEPFLESEFPMLIEGFEEILIFTESIKGESRIEYSCAEIHLIDSICWKSRISSLLNKEFYSELNYLRQKGKFKLSTFRAAWYSLTKAISIFRQLESLEDKASFVFYSYWFDEKALALALLKKKYPDLKVVSRAHGWDIYEERHPDIYLPYRNLLAKKLNTVYSISDNGRFYLVNKYSNFKEKIQVIRLGTMPLVSIPKKSNLGIFQILSISSMISLKRVDKILEVVSSIQTIKIKWTHIGTGPEFERIKKLAKLKRQENPNFSFEILGHVPNSELRELLSNQYFDLFINLSETEGIPVSIMEAQSAGLPVLATNVGGSAEIVSRENGFLVDKNFNTQDVVSLIQKFFSENKIVQKRKRNASFKSWENNYSYKNYRRFTESLQKS